MCSVMECKNKQTGFTLLELLVTIVIIAIASSIIVIRSSDSRLTSQSVDSYTREISSLIELAKNKAIFSNSVIAVRVLDNHIQFLQFDINNRLGWQSIETDDSFWRQRVIPEKFVVRMQVGSNQMKLTVSNSSLSQILLFPSGEITPFIISIHQRDKHADYKIVGHYNGDISVVKP